MTDRDGEALWPKMRFELMYTTFGSGLGMAWDVVNELDLEDIHELVALLAEQKEKEAKSLETK